MPRPCSPALPPSSSSSSLLQVDFPQVPPALLSNLNRQRLQGQLCDVSIRLQGREFRAHRAVLAASSPFFHDQLLLKKLDSIELPSVMDPGAFALVLGCAYTGRLAVAPGDVVNLLTVGSVLQMWHIVDKCTELLRELRGSAGNPDPAASSSSSSSSSSSLSWQPRSGDMQSPSSTNPQIPAEPPAPEPEFLAPGKGGSEEEEEEEEEGSEEGSTALLQKPPWVLVKREWLQEDLVLTCEEDEEPMEGFSQENEGIPRGNESGEAGKRPRAEGGTLGSCGGGRDQENPGIRLERDRENLGMGLGRSPENPEMGLGRSPENPGIGPGRSLENPEMGLRRSPENLGMGLGRDRENSGMGLGRDRENPGLGLGRDQGPWGSEGIHGTGGIPHGTAGISCGSNRIRGMSQENEGIPHGTRQVPHGNGGMGRIPHGTEGILTRIGISHENKGILHRISRIPHRTEGILTAPGRISQENSGILTRISGIPHQTSGVSPKPTRAPDRTEGGSPHRPPRSVAEPPPVEQVSSCSSAKVFVCHCGKAFSHRSMRQRHVNMHLDLRPFTCPECRKRFKMKHHLSEHMKTHTGLRPYTCPGCQRRFMWRDSFVRHRGTCTGTGAQ